MPDIMETIVKKVEDIFKHAEIEANIEPLPSSDIATNYINVASPDGRLLIGARGENLVALEYILKRLLEKELGEAPKMFLDINGYRMHRVEELKEEAKQVAKKARLYRKELMLKPMSAFERRIIHMALAEYPDITTESVGEGGSRRVVIRPYP